MRFFLNSITDLPHAEEACNARRLEARTMLMPVKSGYYPHAPCPPTLSAPPWFIGGGEGVRLVMGAKAFENAVADVA
jgi:hypothetical protein